MFAFTRQGGIMGIVGPSVFGVLTMLEAKSQDYFFNLTLGSTPTLCALLNCWSAPLK